MQDRWVRCEDAIPELRQRQTIKESEPVLICTGYGQIDIAFFKEHNEMKKTVLDGFYLKQSRELVNDVIAWMPLPEPLEV